MVMRRRIMIVRPKLGIQQNQVSTSHISSSTSPSPSPSPTPSGSRIQKPTHSRKSVLDWQLSGQQLEKRFIRAIGGISWKHVIENQRYTYKDERIMKWEDSAVKEAYWDARKRFLAKIHGEPCDAQLPDPNMFIDNIDWDSAVDPKLLSDLDNGEIVQQDDIGGVIIEIPLIVNYDLTPTGWGDAADVKPPEEVIPIPVPSGWEDDYVYTSGDQENRVDGSSWNNYRKEQAYYGNAKPRENGKGGHDGGWSRSRYKMSRFVNRNNNKRLFENNIDGERHTAVAWKPVNRWS